MMNRRAFLESAFATPLVVRPSHAASQPWRARYLAGSFDGAAYHGGLHITMDDGWKTYWRVPGAGGIPPTIEGHGQNLMAFTFDCPLPVRFPGIDGETIGYKTGVVFPFTAQPADSSMPLRLALSAFVGVCAVICIPAKIDGEVDFQPASSAVPDALLLNQWNNRVPQRTATGPVLAVRAGFDNGGVFLSLDLASPVKDIFVEAGDGLYFSAPVVSGDGKSARIAVAGLASPAPLAGMPLRITSDLGGMGLEQMVTVV